MENSSTVSYEQDANDPTAHTRTPKAPSTLLLHLKNLPLEQLQLAIAQLPAETILALTYDWEFWARPNQLEPLGDWLVWFILTGRGFGKTRTGAELVRKKKESKLAKAIGLVAPTVADVRDTMIGLKPGAESGLLQVCPPWDRPVYRPSYRELVWSTGEACTIFSGEEPDRIRGPQHDLVWWDEPAATPHPDEVESNILYGLRLGESKMIITGTPLPLPLIRRLKKDAEKTKLDPSIGVVMTTGSMWDNPYLSEASRRNVRRKYEGTRLGRQEIYGEVLDDNPDALFKQSIVDEYAIKPMVFAALVRSGEIRLKRIVVSIDPATTKKKTSNKTGIMVCAIDQQEPPHGYVLKDLTLSGSPDEWARVAIAAYKVFMADRVIAEVNNGGDMVEDVIHSRDPNIPYDEVHASRGKMLRAEPIASLYEQGRIHHIREFGPSDPEVSPNPNQLAALEDQMFTFDGSQESPDRLDSMVWGFTELILDEESTAEAAIAYLERRILHCTNCKTMNYLPAGDTTLFCRQCRTALTRTIPPVQDALVNLPEGIELPEDFVKEATTNDLEPALPVSDSGDPADTVSRSSLDLQTFLRGSRS